MYKLMELGVEPPRMCGYFMAVELYVDEACGEEKLIFKDTQTIRNEEWMTLVGKVVAMGPDCFTGQDRFGNPRFPSGPTCAIGDYVTFRANDPQRLTYRGVKLGYIHDDQASSVVPDPSYVTRS